MRQQERRARTIALLFREASAAIARRGYEGTTLELIAAGAGLSKGAVYAHFARKLDLFILVVERTLDHANDRLAAVAEAVEAGATPSEAGRKYVTADYDPNHAGLMAEIWRLAPNEPAVRELLNTHREARKTAIGAAAVDAGSTPQQALAIADLVAKLIDAEIVETRLSETYGVAV